MYMLRKKYFLFMSVFLGILLPRITYALWKPGDPLVPCDGGTTNPCSFASLIELADNAITFLTIYITVPLAAVAFGYAGFLYLTATGSESQITKAHSVFRSVAIGLFFVFTAFLIVELITSTFLNDSINTYLNTYFFN